MSALGGKRTFAICVTSQRAIIDRQALAPILGGVIRLLILMLCALGLALSPLTASSAGAPTSSMPGCTMGGEMPDMPADHSTMDCCTPACQAPASPAMLPLQDLAADPAVATAGPTERATRQLTSLVSSGLDPPPRL